MKAVVFDGKLRVVDDYPEPVAAAQEVIVDVHLAGICQTDIEITRGYMDFRGVLGHEFVGTVRSCGGHEGRPLVGRRVVGEINCVCGQCEMCRMGLSTHCQRRTVLGISGRDGCMAQRVAIPVDNVHRIADGVSDEEAVLVEPLAAAFQVAQQVKLNPRQQSVVIGDGRLGQLIAQVMQSHGVRPLVIGKHAEKLRRLERMGISCLTVDEARPRNDAHLVVEASGSADGFRMAMDYVRSRGTIVLKSTIAADSGINLAPVVVNEITVLGSRCGPFPQAIAALNEGSINLDGLISGSFPLEKAAEAFEAAQRPENLKIVLRNSGGK